MIKVSIRVRNPNQHSVHVQARWGGFQWRDYVNGGRDHEFTTETSYDPPELPEGLIESSAPLMFAGASYGDRRVDTSIRTICRIVFCRR
jgi:hypothetical protein